MSSFTCCFKHTGCRTGDGIDHPQCWRPVALPCTTLAPRKLTTQVLPIFLLLVVPLPQVHLESRIEAAEAGRAKAERESATAKDRVVQQDKQLEELYELCTTLQGGLSQHLQRCQRHGAGIARAQPCGACWVWGGAVSWFCA